MANAVLPQPILSPAIAVIGADEHRPLRKTLEQERQLRSIAPQAQGPTTLAPLDLEHMLVHPSVRHSAPPDSNDWPKRTNAHTRLSKATAEN